MSITRMLNNRMPCKYFSVLIWLAGIQAFGWMGGRSGFSGERALPSGGIPTPPAVAALPEGDRLEHLLDSIGEDPVFFNYALNAYIKMPALLGISPETGISPGEVLSHLAARRKELEGGGIPPHPEDADAVVTSMEDQEFRRWLRIVGLLASGKRATHSGAADDGGREYTQLFAYSGALAATEPEFLFTLAEEFIQFAERPPRSRVAMPIGGGRESVRMFLPPLLGLAYTPKREPDLARLVPGMANAAVVEEALDKIPPEAWESFPALLRATGLLAAFRKPPHSSAIDPKPVGLGGFASLETPLMVLRSCIEHEDFAGLPAISRDAIFSVLAFYRNEGEL